MKPSKVKKTKSATDWVQIRVWRKSYERLRKRSFEQRKPITRIVDDLSIQKPLRVRSLPGV